MRGLLGLILALDAEIARLRIESDTKNAAAAKVLDQLWALIVLSRRGDDFGTWEYPGDAYNCIKSEFLKMRAEIARLRQALRQVERFHDTSDICNDVSLLKWCDMCGCFFDQGHGDHCPFKVLEDDDG